MNSPLLSKFYADKALKKEVFDFIIANAKELLVEYATKQKPTDWFLPLLETLQDADTTLTSMFEVEKTTKPMNRAK